MHATSHTIDLLIERRSSRQRTTNCPVSHTSGGQESGVRVFQFRGGFPLVMKDSGPGW